MFINHVHLFPHAVRPDATLDAFLRLMDDFEFEGAVCFAPFTYQYKKAARPENNNVWLANTIKHRSDLIGYGTLDPSQPAGPQVKEIAELGFRGIKLHPPAQGFEIIGEWARTAYEAMQEHQLVADFHLGIHTHRLRDYNPLDCDEIAHYFPELKMVFEHVGGWHFYRQVLAVITNNSLRGNHLYAGIASVLDRENQRYWHLGAEGLEECRWQIGSDLLIYGLDFPYNQGAELRRDLALIQSLNWPADDVKGLLGGNLRRLLGLDGGKARTVGGDPCKG